MAADRSPAIGVLEFGRAILHDEARALDALADSSVRLSSTRSI